MRSQRRLGFVSPKELFASQIEVRPARPSGCEKNIFVNVQSRALACNQWVTTGIMVVRGGTRIGRIEQGSAMRVRIRDEPRGGYPSPHRVAK
jgi:hypothetical protein